MFYIPRLWFVAKRVEKRVFFSEVSGDVTNLVQEFHLAFPPGEMEGKGEGGREGRGREKCSEKQEERWEDDIYKVVCDYTHRPKH